MASSGPTCDRPLPSSPKWKDGNANPMSLAAAVTSGADMTPPIQAIAVPTSSAARLIGMLPGSFMSVSRPMSSNANTGSATHASAHMRAAGSMEMNVMEMPASVPSIAARGAHLRMYGPTKAPMSTMTPMMNAHARPASQARMGSLVCR